MADYQTLYEQWREQDDERALSSLMDELTPMIERKVHDITPPDMSKQVVRARTQNQVVQDLPDWEPDQSAVSTYLYNFTFPKINRFVNKRQNFARIPEARIQKITSFDTAKDKLKDKFDREPADKELSDELGWSIKEVQRMKQSRRQEIPSSNVEMMGNISDTEFSPADDMYHYLIYELDPREEKVFRHLTGFEGTEKMTGQEIADELDVSPATVSNIKQKIEEKMEQYI